MSRPAGPGADGPDAQDGPERPDDFDGPDGGPGGRERPGAPPGGPDSPDDADDPGDLIAFTEDDAPEGDDERRAGRGRRGLLMLIGGGSAVLVAAGLAGALALFGPLMAPEDFEGNGSVPVAVEIVPGASAAEIADVLTKAEVVAGPRSFIRVVEERGQAGSLRPGRYLLRKRMAAASALDLLLAPQSRIRKRVTVPEGLRAVETVARLAQGSGLPAAELAKVIARPADLGLPAYAKNTVEGFLFPATYDIESSTTPRDLMRSTVRRFKRAATHVGLEAGAAQHRLTPRDVVVVASIVQAEGGRDSDYPKIARVIYNRLASGAKLEMDSTVMYGLGKHGIVASNAEIKRDTPYNTYMHPGLPPGPISNPGEAALRAALHPAKGDWYWFVTIDPQHRITKFTDKESEFVKYREELNKRLGQH
ncbi:endolytic transglycosylase MltG [Sphaerisporangium perillae]|uniref:endolytic transglycosylase MltG n=1 Tax=Sphaerisporangium perillae TaxID=2935860 RepID=UPI00200F0E04|nr:endolytic transglycosylase MltG [Sphaerisporangium perillae]